MTLARHLAADDHRTRLDDMSRDQLIAEALRLRANRDAVAHLAVSYADLVQQGRRRELAMTIAVLVTLALTLAVGWLWR